MNSAKNELIRERKRPFREPSDAGSDEFNEMKKIHSDTGIIALLGQTKNWVLAKPPYFWKELKIKVSIFPPTHHLRTLFGHSKIYCQFLLPYQKGGHITILIFG